MGDRYSADLVWKLRDGEDFRNGRYSRAHSLSFDGGAMIPASASPHIVGKWADVSAIDPEEMLVAAMASCHMLSFLHVARLAGFDATTYRDHAEGVLEANASGKLAVTKVTLRPRIDWKGAAPDDATLTRLHSEAHEACFIANSVKTDITIA